MAQKAEPNLYGSGANRTVSPLPLWRKNVKGPSVKPFNENRLVTFCSEMAICTRAFRTAQGCSSVLDAYSERCKINCRYSSSHAKGSEEIAHPGAEGFVVMVEKSRVGRLG